MSDASVAVSPIRTQIDVTTPFHERVARLSDPALLAPYVQALPQASNPEKTSAMVVAYIDARAVAAILDKVVGPAYWSFHLAMPPMHQSAGGWIAHGRLELTGPGLTVVREDTGTNDSNTLEMGAKGAASDALKRCAMQLGVGRALATLPKPWIPCKPFRQSFKVEDKDKLTAIRQWQTILGSLQDSAAAPEDDEGPADATPAPQHGEPRWSERYQEILAQPGINPEIVETLMKSAPLTVLEDDRAWARLQKLVEEYQGEPPTWSTPAEPAPSDVIRTAGFGA